MMRSVASTIFKFFGQIRSIRVHLISQIAFLALIVCVISVFISQLNQIEIEAAMLAKKNPQALTVLTMAQTSLVSCGILLSLFTFGVIFFSRRQRFFIRSLELDRDGWMLAFESMGDAVIVVNHLRRVELINTAAQKLTGWPLTQAKGQLLDTLFHVISESNRAPYQDLISHVLKQKKPISVIDKLILVSQRGQEFLIDLTLAPMTLPSGAIVGVVLAFSDAGERRKERAQLVASEQRYESLTNHVPALLWTSNANQKFDWFNDAWFEFTGASKSIDPHQAWELAVKHADRLHYLSLTRAAYINQIDYEVEYQIRQWDGSLRWMVDRGTPRRGLDHGFLGFTGSSVDITNRKEYAIKLENLASELTVALKARETFLTIASHELKTPLTALKLQLQMTERALKAGPDLKQQNVFQSVKLCLNHTDRLTGLIEELLDVAHIQAGDLHLYPERVDFVALVQMQIKKHQDAFKNAGCTVSVDAPENLFLNCDSFRMKQVVINLLSNALKYAAHSPIHIRIYKKDQYALFEVQDGGAGISKDKQELIFGRFEKAIEEREVGGLGLGLYIVRQILEAHGSRIEVESDIGKGTKFTVMIPLHFQFESDHIPDNLSEGLANQI